MKTRQLLMGLTMAGLVAGCTSQSGDHSVETAEQAPRYGSWGFETDKMDAEVKPGDDFFRHANGQWLATTQIPAERSRWGTFSILRERSEERVRDIIEELGSTDSAVGSPEQKVGDYYASWMNVERLNDLGINPLQPDLDQIGRAHV